MSKRPPANGTKLQQTLRTPSSRLSPLAQAIALALAGGGVIGSADAQQAFSPAWFASKGAVQSAVGGSGGQLPNGAPASLPTNSPQQQLAAQQLQRSIGNLNLAARVIAAQQAAQAAARQAALGTASTIPDGLAQGGLKVDTNSLTAGWVNAKDPTQSVSDGRTTVAIKQTADKAILNWETFNVGRNTTVDFQQEASWSVLNRINDPQARPSQIQGQIKADGTVLIVNRNGVVFNGTSQVNTRNLVAAAVGMKDDQFRKGLYSAKQGSAYIPTFANDLVTTANSFSYSNATADVIVEAGAKIQTHQPETVTDGGGYVLLAGREAHNSGQIITANGQTTLAAGDAFVTLKGQGTEQNQTSTTRGNVVTSLRKPVGVDAGGNPLPETSGAVSNDGLIQASTGDITLVGRDVRQQGVAVATTSVSARGSIHLLNDKADTAGKVTLSGNSLTSILLDDSATTALDVQREALIKDSDKPGDGIAPRRDQSLVQITSGGMVDFARDSITLATSGQVLVNSVGRTQVHDGATIDVSGAVGVRIAMEANNVLINVQGFEQRDAPGNRDTKDLNNSKIWLDRRTLVHVPAGTNGYEGDRWYTAGGLLEVGGYLGITGHSIAEWSAQGGTVQFSGGEVVTQRGSSINLSGGTLDVQAGKVYQTLLKGVDGQLYEASKAPGDLLYTGLYKGFESTSARWGNTEYFYNPLIGGKTRLENGYTVGRDGGQLIVSTQAATLQGDIETATFQGERQQRARDNGLDGYQQAQTAIARNGQLIIGTYAPVYDKNTGNLRFNPGAVAEQVVIGAARAVATDPATVPTVSRIDLDADWLNGLDLGALKVYAVGKVDVEKGLTVASGGGIALHASEVNVKADLTARGGSIQLGNLVERPLNSTNVWGDSPIAGTVPQAYKIRTTIDEGVTLDTRGIWTNLMLDSADIDGLPFIDGGNISVRSSGDVVLKQGSLLDTSSGAALLPKDTLKGGKGGNISLVANGLPSGDTVDAGKLTLQGEVRSHGVKGGGTLLLQSGGAVVIGGQVAGSDGVLQAGQSSLVDLVTQEAFTVAKGAILPLDYVYMRTLAKPGEVLGSAPVVSLSRPETYLTLAAPWTMPRSGNSGAYTLTLGDGSRITQYSWNTLPDLPAGTVITDIVGDFPTAWVVPADVFPTGMMVKPAPGVLKAGNVAPTDATYESGTRVTAGTRLPQNVAVETPLHLDAKLFQEGFSRYKITGHQSLAVAEGATINVVVPVLQIDGAASGRVSARSVATGVDPSTVLSLWQPPVFSDDPTTGQITQRKGADLQLNVGKLEGSLPRTLSIGRGATLSVDPGHSIGLRGNGQMIVDGALHAAGGHIDLQGYAAGPDGLSRAHDRSIWIGDEALLDVSGVVHTALDAQGHRHGTVLNGGAIQIGGQYQADATQADGVEAFIVIRPGAGLDASGTSATLDLPQLGATSVASAGGLIYLSSFNGLFIDGDLRAAAGGPNAAGGTLALTLESPNYLDASNPDQRVRSVRELELVRTQTPEALASDLQPGQSDPALNYGHARIGVDRIKTGGFDNLSLLVNGVLSIEAGVDLKLGQSLRLTAGNISLEEGAARGAAVSLAAPYVRLAGATRFEKDHYTMPYPKPYGLPSLFDGSRLIVDSNLLDVIEDVEFGTSGKVAKLGGGFVDVQRPGFETVELRSQGDLRFLKQVVKSSSSLNTVGDLVLAASQVYPATGAQGEVTAGQRLTTDKWGNIYKEFDPERSLRIERTGTTDPQVPFSVFGGLHFMSANIDQGGVLRAPLGAISLDHGTANFTAQATVVLRPGSVTSASAAGLVMPYGGTVDGLTYVYNGLDVAYQGLGGQMGSVRLSGDRVDMQSGAVVDLSGGGQLTGAAFLSGRGGSTDARLNPLVQLNTDGSGFVLPSLVTNPVYAIVPGVQPGYAPVAAEKGAGDPMLGRQITIGNGVQGLAAGTYTLLPSTYALLPGAFRVELNGLASSVSPFGLTSPTRNGSWSTSVQLGIVNTNIHDALPTQAILTPAATLRTYSQYNETSFAQFGLNWAARDGVPRPLLERDAKVLVLEPGHGVKDQPGLDIAPGVVRFAPVKDGYGGTAVLKGDHIEILADGSAPTEDFEGLSIHARTLNDLGAATLSIGGDLASTFADTARKTQYAGIITVGGSTEDITLREGAVLSAPQIFLISGRTSGGITVEQGAGINTLGKGAAPWDSTLGYVFAPVASSVLAVSNGKLDLIAPRGGDPFYGPGSIRIGACAEGASCSGTTQLYSEGTITASTDKSFVLGDSVRYGTRNLVLAMGGINVGSAEALAAAAAKGTLPSGLTLNQQVLDRLLLGDTSIGAPALESLVLTARDSVNFYQSVSLSTLNPATGKSALDRLVIDTPAIYGYGDASDQAHIKTDTLVWNGALTPPGSVVAGGAGTGTGQLSIDARRIEFGYGPHSQPDTVHELDRLTLGFSTVNLNASERITANQKGALSVYQSQGAWDDHLKAYTYSGGDLNISTPLLTGHAGSVNKISAGGNISAVAPAGSTSPLPDNATLADALGAELVLDAKGGLTLDTSVLLPSGKLTLSALGSVALADGARLDLAGRKIDFYDVSKYSWGGEVILDSRSGNITQSAGSSIDLSAQFNRAGKLTATALGDSAGTVDLAGTLKAGSSGHYDAGGTEVLFAAGYVDVRGQHITDFVGLNKRLTEGQVFGGRSFQLKQGSLTIGDEVKAREVNVSVDNGGLIVTGTIDASGEQVGSIRLAANAGVTLAGTAVLNTSASVLRKDSYGQVIEAPNRAVIEIDSGEGRLTLESGTRVDLRVAGANQSYGTLILNAPRLGGATGNDVDIEASGTIQVDGAKTITVNAFHRYDDTLVGTDPTVDGRSYQVIDQAYLDAKHADSVMFIDNALANGGLMNGKLKGLTVYKNEFHLRPGVEIVSNTVDGDLHIDGDIDLSGYRYASVNPLTQRTNVRGSGEAGALVLRAAGNLVFFGSVSDGFDGSALPVTADDKGWILPAGHLPWGADVIIPHGGLVTLAPGSVFAAGRTLNYDLPIQGVTLSAGAILPVAMSLNEALTLPAGTVLGAAVRDSNGNVLHAAGTVLQQPLDLQAGMQLDAGFRLPSQTQMAAMVWPKGVALPSAMTLAQPLTLAKGAIVPSETDIVLPGDAVMVNLRPADAAGNQGRTWALAPMLQQGSRSFDVRLVAGADLSAADSRMVNTHSTGTLRLADTHFGLGYKDQLVPGSAIWVWADNNWAGMPAGEPVDPEYLQYCTDDPTLCRLEGNPVYESVPYPARQQLFSVLRTGTGDLDLLSGGDFDMTSPYGVYTAGTASAPLTSGQRDPYNQPRGKLEDGTVLLKKDGTLFESLVDGGPDSLYKAWYPEQGGNVLLRAQGDVKGDLIGHAGRVVHGGVPLGNVRQQIASVDVGSWLWRQGTGSVDSGSDAVPTAWWINFGTYVYGPADGASDDYNSWLTGNMPFLTGFTGIGTLGGGNLSVEAGGNAGMIDVRGDSNTRVGSDLTSYSPRSQGLHLAVGSTGRVTASGQLVQTGGGDLDLRLGGTLNPNPALRGFEHDLNSTLVNLRGALDVQAGAVGGLQLRFGTPDHLDSRAGDPYTAGRSLAGGGPVLIVGDSTARVETRGDLVLGAVVDPGRTLLYSSTPFSFNGTSHDGGGWSWFSLWTPATAVDLFSAGGNLTPTTAWADGTSREDVRAAYSGRNQSPTGDGYFYPSILRAAAANGSLYYGVDTTNLSNYYGTTPLRVSQGLTLAPSPHGDQFVNVTGKGELQLLASDSIYASGYAITASTADPQALTNPFRPGFVGMLASRGGGQWGDRPVLVHNVSGDVAPYNDWANDIGRYNGASLFTFGTPATSAYAAQGQEPARFYAVDGDIEGLRTGSMVLLGYLGTGGTRYEGSIPVAIRAGRDITDSGTPLGKNDTVEKTRGNLISHGFADDVSIVEAGRDIRYSSFYITGPGLLEVTAGRDLYFADKGEVKSLGPIVNVTPGDRSSGASVVLAAAMGPGAQWKAFADRYLDPNNQADLNRPFADQPGKVLYVYSGGLTQGQWLQREFGYSGDEAGATAFMAARQVEVDQARKVALAEGRTAPSRSLAREYKIESGLHLVNWLSERFGGKNGLGLHFDATTMDARAFFSALPIEQQRAYLRNVYYAELKASGREYNDVDSKRYGSYLRGREAIATLLPEKDAKGNEIAYKGDLTLFSSALYYDSWVASNGIGKDRPTPGKKYITKAEWEAMGSPGYDVAFYDVLDAGIHTDFGGDISIMTPGGRTLVGVDGGFTPGPGSGVMTQGEGDINIYARGDILMGQSRIFTTYGGNILGWSATGDINAGRGSKTTVVYTPLRRVYDDIGNVTLSPNTPSTGAGIATLNPIPEIPPGDVDLVAPLGTIDAGEAGIRVSGNVNLAALHVVNAENIQVQGKSVGIPVVAAVNVAALTNASAAASQAANAVQEVLQRERAATRQALPSIFNVRVLGFGNEPISDSGPQTQRSPTISHYDVNSPVQVLGTGRLSEAQKAQLTVDERRMLTQ